MRSFVYLSSKGAPFGEEKGKVMRMKLWLLVPVLLLAWFVQGAELSQEVELVPRMLILTEGVAKKKSNATENTYSLKSYSVGTIIKGTKGSDSSGVFWKFPVYERTEYVSPIELLLRFPEAIDEDPECGFERSSDHALMKPEDDALTCKWTSNGVYEVVDSYWPFNFAPELYASGTEVKWTFLIFWEEE